MKRNKLKVLSSLAILGIAGLGLAACNNNTESGTTPSPTPTPTDTGSGATTTPTPTPTPTPVPTTPSQTTTTTPNQSSTTNPDQNQIESISVSGQTKEFLPGSEFVFGGTVTKNYSDGSQVVATEEEYIVTIYTDSSYETEVEDKNIKAAGTYYVVVSIGDKLATYEIVVREAQQTIHELTDFDSLATGDVSEAKELYNQNNNKVSLTANANSGIKIDKSGESYNDLKFAQRLNFKGQTIKGQTEPVSNGVVADGIVSITVANPCTIKVYAKSSGDQKRPIRLTNTADYTKNVLTTTKSSLGCNEFKIETAGTYYLYQTDVDKNNYPEGESESTLKNGGLYIYGIGIEYEVPASSVTYSEIKVDAKNAITDFNVGTEFDKTGLVVKGLSNLGTWEELTDYTVTNEDGSDVSTANVGKYKLKVTYGELNDYYDIQVLNPEATVTNIEVKHAADQLVYKKGETLDLTGLVITATDSDSLVQDISYDKDVISYKVLSGENDVTDTFTELTKGAYKVELTYKSATTEFDITMLEVKEGTFNYKNEVAVGSDSYASSLVISYTDGTDADWSKYNDTILSTAKDYSTKFYSDAACANLIDTATNAFEAAGTVYMKLSYQDYSSDVITLTVKNFNSESYSTSGLTVGTDYKNSVLFEGNLVDVKVGTGSCKADDAKEKDTMNHEVQIKLDDGAGKEIIFVVKQKITLKIAINASGKKKYVIKDSTGTVVPNGSGNVGITKDSNTIVEITLEAGTYTLASDGGGVRFAGIEATKAE